MKTILFNITKVILLVALTVFVVEKYLNFKMMSPQRYPIVSMYELMNKPLDYYLKEREVALLGYFGDDNRLYVNESDYKYQNLSASYKVEYQEFMEKCQGSYVHVGANVKLLEDHNEIVFYNFKQFSIASKREPKQPLKSLEGFNKELKLYSKKINCEVYKN